MIVFNFDNVSLERSRTDVEWYATDKRGEAFLSCEEINKKTGKRKRKRGNLLLTVFYCNNVGPF